MGYVIIDHILSLICNHKPTQVTVPLLGRICISKYIVALVKYKT